MSIHSNVYRDASSGVGACDRPIVRRMTSQNRGADTPIYCSSLYSNPRQGTGTPSCSFHGGVNAMEQRPQDLHPGRYNVEVLINRPPVSRMGSMTSRSSIIHRDSEPSTPFWSPGSSANQSPRGFHDMQRNQTQNVTTEVISPRLTRTQRSYINASPPSAREALTMRFIKANMTHSPRPEAANQIVRTVSQPSEGYSLTRNASAPVGALTRTNSIQPQPATPAPVTVTRRGLVNAMSQRQISEPIGHHVQAMSEQQLSPVQREIEALNRAMQEFHENLSISPRVLQDVPESQPLVSQRTEPDSEMHTMYEPCPSPRGPASYQERVVYNPYVHQCGHEQCAQHHAEHIQYVSPLQIYYTASYDSEPPQEPSVAGLPDDIISQFPVTEFDDVAAEKWNEDVKTCSICLEQYKRGDRVRRLACTHGYHKVCIDEWLTRSSVCPICKFDYEIMLR